MSNDNTISQPYEIPKNWHWIKMGSICQFERGITFPKKAKEKESSEENIPCLRTTNVQEELFIDDLIYVDKKYMKNNPAKLVRNNDIIMSSANSRELVGKTCYINELPFPMTFGGFVLNIRAKDIVSEYLFYFLRYEFLFDNFKRLAAQTVNIANINTTKLSNYFIPLPPIEIQNKIVKNIHSLFEKLDKAKKLLQNIVDNYEMRRSVILHKAFDIPYVKIKLSKVLSVSKETTTDFSNPNLKYIGLDNIKKDCGIISYENTKKIKSTKNVFKMGQILYGKLRPYLNKHDVAKFDGVCSTDIIVFNHCDNTLADYINYYFDTEKFINYIVPKAKGNTLPRVTKKDVLEAECPLPPYEKQKEIVCILDNLLSKEQRTKELAENVLNDIKLMEKKILSLAFRGELC